MNRVANFLTGWQLAAWCKICSFGNIHFLYFWRCFSPTSWKSAGKTGTWMILEEWEDPEVGEDWRMCGRESWRCVRILEGWEDPGGRQRSRGKQWVLEMWRKLYRSCRLFSRKLGFICLVLLTFFYSMFHHFAHVTLDLANLLMKEGCNWRSSSFNLSSTPVFSRLLFVLVLAFEAGGWRKKKPARSCWRRSLYLMAARERRRQLKACQMPSHFFA